MKKHLLLISIFLGVSILSSGQKTFNEGGFYFELPGNYWHLTNKVEINSRMDAAFYKRVALKDEKGLKVTPNIAVLIEDLPVSNVDIDIYSRHHKSSERYQHIEMELTSEVSLTDLPNSVVYEGTYSDPRNKEHKLLIVYAVNGKKALHFITDIRSDLFKDIEDEFIDAIKSITVKPAQ